jgi:F-type H+-transporting ATPase subunit epsilon
MRLQLLLPTKILFDQPVQKIVAEAENGAFCLLPNHVDWVTLLVPGIFTVAVSTGEDRYWAIDQGVLVKCGSQVRVSAQKAIPGSDLAHLQQMVQQEFHRLDDQEKQARHILARLENSFVRELGTQQLLGN